MADNKLTYEFEVDGRVHRTRDDILDGRQIRKGAVVKPEADAEPEAVAATLQACATEEEVYAAVGLPRIPPEIR